jgi:pimeloyl-ACP methyl ester carboxylesterase
MALGLGEDVFVAQSEALRTRPDQRHVLPSLNIPVLIACGEEDRLCPPEWHRAMAADAQHATLHVVPGAGHMLPLEQPSRLAAMIDEWRTR